MHWQSHSGSQNVHLDKLRGSVVDVASVYIPLAIMSCVITQVYACIHVMGCQHPCTN